MACDSECRFAILFKYFTCVKAFVGSIHHGQMLARRLEANRIDDVIIYEGQLVGKDLRRRG